MKTKKNSSNQSQGWIQKKNASNQSQGWFEITYTQKGRVAVVSLPKKSLRTGDWQVFTFSTERI